MYPWELLRVSLKYVFWYVHITKWHGALIVMIYTVILYTDMRLSVAPVQDIITNINFWSTKGRSVPRLSVIKANLMVTSSNGNIFRVTVPFCGVFAGQRWTVNSPHTDQWRGAFIISLICAWINAWVNNREAGDFRRHRVHYNITVMSKEDGRICPGTMVLSSCDVIGRSLLGLVLCFTHLSAIKSCLNGISL